MGFSAATIEELAKPLDPSLIKQRQGGGGTMLDYVEGHEVQNIADRIFGAGCWSNRVVSSITVPIQGTTLVKFEVIQRVSVSDENGLTLAEHDGLGAAVIDTARARPDDAEFQSKAAATDALKRAFVNLGNAFGRHLYDKDDPNRHAQQAAAPAQGANPAARAYNRANGQQGAPTNGAPAAILPDDGQQVPCESCGKIIEGYQSGPKSKFQGAFVTAAQLRSDSKRLKGKELCSTCYRASF